jgi:hypothetical protein
MVAPSFWRLEGLPTKYAAVRAAWGHSNDMKTATQLQSLRGMLESEQFSRRGASLVAVVVAALSLGACQNDDNLEGATGGSRTPGAATPGPQVIPPPVLPPGTVVPPATPPGGVDQPPGTPPPPSSTPTGLPPVPEPGPLPPPPPLPPGGQVTIVVGTVANLTPGDQALIRLVEGLGFQVRRANDSQVGGQQTAGSAVVVIAGSAAAGVLMNQFRNTAVPLVVMNNLLLDNLAMTAATNNRDFGTAVARQVEISAEPHPITAGLTGRIEVLRANAALPWGAPPAGAKVLASIVQGAGQGGGQGGGPGGGQGGGQGGGGMPLQRAALFAYDKGDMMQGQPAPDRRVHVFTGANAAANLTPDGEKLFQNAVLWAWSGQASERPR